jgi:four helix bundle protein
MINKMKIAEEESDETEYWLELLVEAEIVPQSQITGIYKDTDEILAMTVSSVKTLCSHKS